MSDRRKQLEAELAALEQEHAGYDVSSAASSPAFETVPMPAVDGESRSRSGSGGNGKNGAFEEVEVPSDMEGDSPSRPSQAQRGSWFGWAGAEKGKTD